MKEFLLYIHQLPQNLLGLCVVLLSKTNHDSYFDVYFTEYKFGVSLGKYIILNRYCRLNSIKHEKGHQEQSRRLGWLYLIIIGLPSLTGNIYDRIAHRKWSNEQRRKWYYAQPWEAWADKLGGVER